ncbi:anti-sigma factor family protein [Nocardioides taihuensis]|uniref:Anti-sigma factor family protein n=1 Tax=Nocardioides taihuensis TaxID=1835606 RepID=A0ABW0BKP1_9ACTN
MTCPFAHDDAAYLIGALAPAERLEFERHLPGCEECSRAVAELAGLPGLLGRVDESVLADPAEEPPVPATLLPALVREVQRRRRRTAVWAGVAAAAVAVVAVGVPVGLSQVGDHGGPPPSASSSAPGAVEVHPMTPVGEVPVTATLGLEQVAWGTRLELTCSYESESVEYQLPSAVDYTLYVRRRDGGTEQVGSWRSVDGTTMHLAAATSADREDIASVEVRTPDGLVVLRLDT